MSRSRRKVQDDRSKGDANTEQQIFDAKTPPDVTSVRAKSTGHRKKTADKWNQ
jgi:hypothetical protein